MHNIVSDIISWWSHIDCFTLVSWKLGSFRNDNFLLFKRSFWQRLQTFSLFNFQGCNFIRLFLFSKELWNTGRVSWQTMHLMTQCLLSPSKNVFTEFPTAGLSCIAVISMGVEDGLSFFSVFVLHWPFFWLYTFFCQRHGFFCWQC